MRFEFATAEHIIFGTGTIAELAAVAAKAGSRALLITAGLGGDATLLDSFAKQGIHIAEILQNLDPIVVTVTHEPTIDSIGEAVRRARETNRDVIIAVGGGSVIDTGKAVGALLANGGEPLDYLEVIGAGRPITKPAIPCIAVPTTAGTGAEVTKNAVLLSPEHRVKVSLRSQLMLPRVALVDPQLTYGLPPEVTASTGLDALTQVLEPYVSHLANPLTDTLCREGMQRAARGLQRAYDNGADQEAREDMSLASLFGGIALGNAKLGAVHGLAGPMGGMFHAPHGVICAALLPHVIEINVRALQERASENKALQRYIEIAQILTGDPRAVLEDGVVWIQALCEALGVPPLSAYGVTEEAFPALIQKASVSSSMKGNPVKLTEDELEEILTRAL